MAGTNITNRNIMYKGKGDSKSLPEKDWGKNGLKGIRKNGGGSSRNSRHKNVCRNHGIN